MVWKLKVGSALHNSGLQSTHQKKKVKKKERKTPWLPYRNAQAFRFVLSAQTLDVLEYFWELK